MIRIRENALQDFITQGDRRLVALVLGAALAVVAVILGIMLALTGPIITGIGLVALAAGIWMITSLENALWATIGIILILPFATLPVDIGFRPTFLDVALGVAVGLYLLQWMTGERRRLTVTPVHAFIILFMVLSVFSFVAGLRYAGLSMTIMRRFAELLLSMAFALVVVDVVKTPEQLKRLVLIILAGGAIAGTLAVGLWVLPDTLAESILRQLSIVGYPSAGIIQYIESNPALNERAIGTSVNPNALGGQIVLVASLLAPQLVTNEPITGKRWHAIPVMGVLVLALVLTFSRGSALAFASAMFVIAALKYRRLLFVMVIIGLFILILPWSQEYIQRFIEGFQGQDLATQMRFGEYRDAVTLITRYPLLGVGFIGTPDIDIYLGVANVYLTIGSNMGLLGLGAFLGVLATLFLYAWSARPHLQRVHGLSPIWLGLVAALVGTMVNGIFDHYFFNLEFMAAVTFFWLYIGLLIATSRMALAAKEEAAAQEALT